MYSKIKKYLNNSVGKLTAAAIMTRTYDAMEVGLPCLLDFTHVSDVNRHREIDIGKIFREAKDIPTELNDLLHNYSVTLPVIYLFSVHNSLPGGYTHVVEGSAYHCTHTKSLIADVSKTSNVKTFNKIFTSKNILRLPDKISGALRRYRYLNYTLSDLCKSNMGATMDQLHRLVASLGNNYPNKVCVYLNGKGDGTLIDTMSISFYKLIDVMPIFDSRRSAGIAVEVLFTNSLLTGGDILKDAGNYFMLRWLFAQYKDNLFTIDGERLKRNFECSIEDTIDGNVYSLLKRNTPDDAALKKKRNRAIKETSLCVE